MIEFFSLVLFSGSLFGLLLARDWWAAVRDRRVLRRAGAMLERLRGGPVAGATGAFGEPSEIVSGTTGASLYIWNPAVARALEAASVPVVVAMTVDPEGRVAAATARLR
ncbi:MAG: hypothetical protein FJW40_15800 [Acidobacteria bacterium]|nr:hypothetical protein [Acidobacteriota bacterium]